MQKYTIIFIFVCIAGFIVGRNVYESYKEKPILCKENHHMRGLECVYNIRHCDHYKGGKGYEVWKNNDRGSCRKKMEKLD